MNIERENPLDALCVHTRIFPQAGFLADLLSCFKILETPSLYTLASGFTILSTVLQDRYLLQEGDVREKLNLYMVLVNQGAAQRAEDALDICVDILKLLEAGNEYPVLYSSNMSLKNLYLLMGGNLRGGGWKYQKQNRGLMVFREYPDLLRQLNENREINPKEFFISAYEGKEEFHSISRTLGEAEVQAPYINLFGCMSFEMAKRYLSKENTYAGLLDRHLFFLAKPSGKWLPFSVKADMELLNRILQQFQELIDKGKKEQVILTFSPEAKERYVQWYEKDKEREEKDTSILSAAFSHNQRHIKKISALYQLAEDGSSEIRLENLERAILLISSLREQRKVIIGTALSDLVRRLGEDYLPIIRENPGISKTELTLRFHGKKGWSKENKDLAIQSLIEDRLIYEHVDTEKKGRHGRHYYPIDIGGNEHGNYGRGES